MSNSPNADNILLGAGAVYFERSNGASTYEVSRHLGNCSSFVLNTEVIRKEIPTLYKEITDLPQFQVVGFNVTGSIVLDEVSRENIALVLAGSNNTSFTQIAVGNITQAYVARKGVLIFIGYTDQSDKVRKFGVTFQDVVYNNNSCLPSDYQVNRRAGTVFIPHTSTIPEGATIYITYSCPEVVIPQISVANNINVSGRITFIGDPTAGPAYLCTIEKAELSFDGLSLIDENFTQLKATYVVTAHKENACQSTEGYYNLIELPQV